MSVFPAAEINANEFLFFPITKSSAERSSPSQAPIARDQLERTKNKWNSENKCRTLIYLPI